MSSSWLLLWHLWKASRRQCNKSNCWVLTGLGKQMVRKREIRCTRTQLYATSYSPGSNNTCPIGHFTWEHSSGWLWPLIPHDLFLTLPPRRIRDSKIWQWEWHKAKLSTTQIKWTWSVETSVLRISGESQRWRPIHVIQATCEVETGRMVV
jgi:hypothetical protein